MIENGAGASKYAVGQRVVGTPWPVEQGNGTWQQFLVVPEDSLVGAVAGSASSSHVIPKGDGILVLLALTARRVGRYLLR